MKKVFMVHGFDGQPNDCWIPWLMSELVKNDIWAFSLAMPTPDKPIKEEWVKTIIDSVREPNDEVFLVGHSLGVSAILRYLETIPNGKNIGGAVLVSGVIHERQKEKYFYIDKFLEDRFNYDHYKNVCKNFIVIHGTDDHSVPFTQGEELSSYLSCPLISILNGGHLNRSTKCYELPEALDSLLKMIK